VLRENGLAKYSKSLIRFGEHSTVKEVYVLRIAFYLVIGSDRVFGTHRLGALL
jgi:hypothetical protein